jgi:hypothetical protein
MVESDYWIDLEFRVCREFAGMPENHFRFLSCDGLIPEQYLLDVSSPCIKGWAWIGNGQKQEQWTFTLFLNHPVGSRSEIEWDALLPPQNRTRWLAVDPVGKRIQIEPSAGVADP